MSGRMASLWLRVGEVTLALLALLVPLAFLLHSYDAASLKVTLLEAGALTLCASWLLKGLERGRWEIPAQALPLLAPAALLAAWTLARFATAPSPVSALPGLLKQLLGLALFAAALLECGGARSAKRFSSWLLSAGWAVALYAILQRAGFDPLPWRGAFAGSSFATLGSPACLGLFAAVCAPLALARLVDPERDRWARGADAALLVALGLATVCAQSVEAVAAFSAAAILSSLAIPFFLPSRSSVKRALAGLALAAGVAAGALTLEQPALEADWTRVAAVSRALRGATAEMLSERPLTGHGPGRFALELDARRPAELIAALGHEARPEQAPGLLAQAAVELGAIGAALWAWLFGAILMAAWKARGRFIQRAALSESARLAGLWGALATLLIAGQWSAAAQETAAGWLLWPLAGLAGSLSLLAGRGPILALPIGFGEPARRRLSLISLPAALALLAFPARWQAADVSLNAAVAAARRGAYGEAARLAQSADCLGATHRLEGRYVAGSALLAAGRPIESLERFAALEAEDPSFALLQFLKGRALFRLGQWELAEAAFERQRALDPTFVPALEGLAAAAKEAGDYSRARQAALSAIALEPKDPLHWLALSDIYARERKLGQARDALQRAKTRRLAPPRSNRG